jgi:hypothetical protein
MALSTCLKISISFAIARSDLLNSFTISSNCKHFSTCYVKICSCFNILYNVFSCDALFSTLIPSDYFSRVKPTICCCLLTAENVHTGQNFFEKAESSPLIRFVRITYVRPASAAAPEVVVDKSSISAALDDHKPETEALRSGTSTSLTVEAISVEHHESTASSETKATSWGSGYTTPKGFNYRTFIPAAVKVGMCSGAPEYETFTATWERAKAWLKCIGKSFTYDLDCVQFCKSYE